VVTKWSFCDDIHGGHWKRTPQERDPCLATGPEGTFHMVWTCGWTTEKGKIIGYAESKDLQHWSDQRAIELMQNEPKTRNIWAPEIFYERVAQRWLIYWSSTIPGRYRDGDNSGDNGYNHRAYYATTTNFQQISESRLFYDPGFNMIDGSIFQAGGQFYFFFKDERKQPLKKNLRYALREALVLRRTSLEGFENVGRLLEGNAVPERAAARDSVADFEGDCGRIEEELKVDVRFIAPEGCKIANQVGNLRHW
jgi:hypothetical protein